MALNFPQADLPSRLRGGADAWDDGVAGLILSEDFFASAITGTVYDVNCSEVTAVSESVGQSVSLTVLSPESATLADSTDRSAVFPAAGAEAAAAGDNVGGWILSELATSEGSAATDEASGGRVYTFMGEYAAESNLLIWEKGIGISVSTVSTPYGDGVRIQRVITGTYEYLQTPAIAKADFKFKIKPDPAANGTLFFPSTDSLNFSGGVITSGGGRVVVTPLDGGWYDVESTGEGWGADNFCTIQILLQSSTNSLGRYIDIQGMEIFSPFGSARLTDSAHYPIEHDEYIVDVENYTDPMTSYPAWRTYPGAIVVDQGWWLFKEDSNYNYHYADKATSARLVTDTFIVEFKFYGGATDRVLSFEHSSYAVYVLSDGTINLSYSWWDSAIEPTAEVLPDGWVRVVIATNGNLTLPKIWLNTANYEFEYAGDPTKGFYLRNLENCQNASTIGDTSVTTGSTNINESQSDAANSLDASTTLMLSLLAEYATGNAIDLPISQYVVLNDTTEAGTNSDTQNGSLLAQSVGSESSPANATHNTTLSTSGAGVEAGTATDTSGTQQITSVVGTAPAPAFDTPVSSAVLQSSETEVASGQDTVLGNYLTSSTGVATGSADNTQGNTLSATASGTGDGAAQETSSTDQGIDTLSQNPSPATDTPVSTALLLSSEVEVASGQDEVTGTYLTSSTSTAASFADSAQSNAMSTGAAGVETSTPTVSQSAQGVALPVSTEAATAADVPASTQVAVVVGVGAGVALDTTTSSATMYASDSESVTATELIDWPLFSTYFASRTEAVSAVDVSVATSAYALSELVNLSPVDIIIAAQTTTSSATELSAATSFQTTDSLVFVSQQDMGVAAEIAQNWITAYLEHAESVLATEWSAGTMLTNQQTLETLAAQEIQTGSMSADSTVAESSPAVDSALAGFTLAAVLAATASGSEILTAQNVGVLAVASEAGVAGDSTTTQLTHLAVAVEAAFSADIGGATAIFIVGHSVQAFGQEVVDGVTVQFSSISEVVAALEALIVEAFGPSKLTPELTRVLLQVATTSVLMRADRIEVLRRGAAYGS